MRKLLVILSFCLATAPAFTQEENNQRGGNRLESLKIAYLTKKLNLSPEEAQRFWPIYNNYASELRSARIEKRNNSISELANDEKVLNIRKKYHSEFGRVLSADKVNSFFRSEKEFSDYVKKELSERRQRRQLEKR